MKIANRVYALIVTLAGAALAVGCSSFTYAQPDAADVVDAADVGEVSDAVDAADIGQGDAMTCAITGQVFCSGSGCTNPQTDQNNCGSCGLQCSRTNGTPSCVVGACAISCTRGYGDCDHEVSTGCEASFDTDSRHCGACGAACPADKVCVASACVCAVGRTLCGTTCVDLATDAANCGGCGLQCVAGSTCNAGWCPLVTQRSCVTAGTPGCGLVPIMYPLTFTMGDSSTDNNGGQPAMSRINLDSFALDAYEVTVARFRVWWTARSATLAAVRSRAIAYPGGQTIEWTTEGSEPSTGTLNNSWTRSPGAFEAHPLNDVDWWTAQEFCVWDGGRLPTEAEWEYAARRASSGGAYPWGSTDPTSACDLAVWGNCRSDDGLRSARVGSCPATLGLFDLVGNVSEWTADNFSAYPLATNCGTSARNPLCLLASESTGRVVRGGDSYVTDLRYLHSVARRRRTADAKYFEIGFRCARSLP